MTRPWGMVHGRFQPFHNEHFDYVLRGLSRCHNLVVGITNPEPSEYIAQSESRHRHQPNANPYSFFQRMEMVRQSLLDIGVHLDRVSFVPFHIFMPEKWEYYLPTAKATTQFVRVFSSWEEKKVQLFRNYGFQIEILDRGAAKNVEGTGVRNLMSSGGDWRSKVPTGTAKVIDKINQVLM